VGVTADVGEAGETADGGGDSIGTRMASAGLPRDMARIVKPENPDDVRWIFVRIGRVVLGGGGRAGGRGPAKMGSLLIIASKPLIDGTAPDEEGAWSSAALGTSFRKSKSPADSETDLRPPEGALENRFRNRETAVGAGAGASVTRSSVVKKSGPRDGGVEGAGGGVVIAGEVIFFEPASMLERDPMLLRGLGTRGEAGRGDPVSGGVDEEAAAASGGMEEARRLQNERRPPPLPFTCSFEDSNATSAFFSTMRHPTGTGSSVVSGLALREASQLDEPFEAMTKWARGLFRLMGRLRVSFSAPAISLADCVRLKCRGAGTGGESGASRSSNLTLGVVLRQDGLRTAALQLTETECLPVIWERRQETVPP
jgi:hypothetical protein